MRYLDLGVLHVPASPYQISDQCQKLRSGDHTAKTEAYPKFYKVL